MRGVGTQGEKSVKMPEVSSVREADHGRKRQKEVRARCSC